jgi:hypothetical protein
MENLTARISAPHCRGSTHHNVSQTLPNKPAIAYGTAA